MSLSSRTAARALLLVVAASLWQAAIPTRVAASQTDLSFISNSTWTADPIAGSVRVLAVVTATSNTIDSGDRHYYYDKIQLTLPAFSSEVKATTTAGEVLPLTVESATESNVVVVVGLGQRLYSGQSGTFDLMFDLVGRSSDRDIRTGHNLMSFPVSAFGSRSTPGSSVTVVFPPNFTVQEDFGDLTRSVLGSGEVVFSSGALESPTELLAWFTAVQPVPASDMRVRYVRIGPLFVGLRYWVDDVGWADEVEHVLRAGYPVLRDMIGLGDPLNTTLTVEEASTQEIGGFAGAYDEVNGQVQVGYLALPFVILHEMAHMWFNSSLVSDRWIQEGFASYYAKQAVDGLGFTDHGVQLLTPQLRQAAIPLNDWVTPGQPGSAVDEYLYAATLDVARQVAALAGQDGLRRVWVAARSGMLAFQPLHAAQTEVSVTTTDWRRLLDLLEQTTGRSYTPIWRLWVMDPSQAGLLQQRDTALVAYADAQKLAGTWDLPPEIRRSLDTWQYGRAMALIDQARGILLQRDPIAAQAAIEQTTAPATLQAVLERSGLAAATAEMNSELAVLDELSAARQARTDSGGAARALGLLGADPQADLVSARAAFAKGDLTRAMSLATRARTAWQTADTAGQIRILGSLSVTAGGLLLLGLFLWIRRDRSRSKVAVAGATVAIDTGPVGAAVAVTRPAKVGSRASRATAGAAATSGGTSSSDHGKAHGVGGPNGRALSAGDGDTADAAAASAAAAEAAVAGGGAGSDESAYELLQRGTALLVARHNAQAAVVLERAARLEQSKGSILEALGRAYFNSGQHARAAETFEALLKVDPSAHYGHFALGLSCARLGREREARTHLRLAVALDPASETYRRALEKIEAAQA